MIPPCCNGRTALQEANDLNLPSAPEDEDLNLPPVVDNPFSICENDGFFDN